MFAKLPNDFFKEDDFLTTSRKFEDGGRFWNRTFKVRAWKKKLPDAASLFGFGFSKKSLKTRDPKYLQEFLLKRFRIFQEESDAIFDAEVDFEARFS